MSPLLTRFALGRCRKQSDDAAGGENAAIVARIGPRVRRDHSWIVASGDDVEDGFGRFGTEVVDVDGHVAVDEPVDRVRAQRRQSANVALLPARVAENRVVLLGRLALLDLPRMPVGQLLAGVDRGSGDALVESCSAERVVELVREDHLADAHRLQLVESRVDIGARAQ
ncbi:Uncharacterised protein [Mycobacteroides abscessus subsp. abscessus]|nr:Uncharacterised protein [Mycobacteroides abscessus subsp. abscessus]